MFKFITTLVLTLASAAAFAAVDLNKADQATLETVKGIGPALSTRLLDERSKGSFKDWPDLIERVGGVGPGNAARLSAAGLTVGDKAYAAPQAGADGFTAKVPRKASDKATQAKAKRAPKDPAQLEARRAERKARKDAVAAEGRSASKSTRQAAKAHPQATTPAAASTGPAMR